MGKVTNIDGLCKDLQACKGKDTYGKPQTINLNKLKAGGYKVQCAGFIKAGVQAYGGNLYNGSNTIFREYLQSYGSISDHNSSNGYPKNVNPLKSTNLQKGMVLFKWQATGCSKAAHQKDGRGNYCHIGMVTSSKPLHIMHASSESGTISMDTKIGKWCAWGRLKCVQYKTTSTASPTTSTAEVNSMEYIAQVTTDTLNVRSNAGTNYARVAKVTKGQKVTVTEQKKVNSTVWCRIQYGNITGWCSGDYLKKVGNAPQRTEPEQYTLEDLAEEIRLLKERVTALQTSILG